MSIESKRSVERIDNLLEGQASLRIPIYRTLAYCLEPRSAQEVEAAIERFIGGQSIYESASILAWLQATGALELAGEMEGDPVGNKWVVTTAGRSVLNNSIPMRRVKQVIEATPKYRDSYLRLLVFCLVPRTREEIERHFEGDPALEEPEVHPTAFIGELEQAGAIEWNTKWKTTDLVKDFLQEVLGI